MSIAKRFLAANKAHFDVGSTSVAAWAEARAMGTLVGSNRIRFGDNSVLKMDPKSGSVSAS